MINTLKMKMTYQSKQFFEFNKIQRQFGIDENLLSTISTPTSIAEKMLKRACTYLGGARGAGEGSTLRVWTVRSVDTDGRIRIISENRVLKLYTSTENRSCFLLKFNKIII